MQAADPTALNDLRRRWTDTLRDMDRVRAQVIGKQAISELGAQAFADQILLPSLETLGMAWERGDVSLAEIYMAGRISEAVVHAHAIPESRPDARIAMAILDDFHALGKTLVLMSLRLAGFEVLDYGRMTPVELARRTMNDGIELLFVSTLMLRSALRVRELMSELAEHECDARVIVGGAPFRMDPELWEHVGAHGTGKSAAAAVEFARRWQEGRR